MARILSIYDEDTGEEVALPTRWHICGTCRGEGASSAYLGAITCGDREPGGMWDDPEAFEDYMSGAYDRPCDDCDGSGKVRQVDESRLTKAQAAAWREAVEDDRQMAALERAERRAGC